MGYLTCYSLNLRTGDNKSNIVDGSVLTEVVGLLRKKEVVGYALDESLGCLEPVKWYSNEEDMREVSKQFPDVLFCLHGEGDDSDDIWDEYFLNGRSQVCCAEIVIPPFDPSKLE